MPSKTFPARSFRRSCRKQKRRPRGGMAQRLLHLLCKQTSVGSSPTTSTNHFIVVFVWSDRQTHRDQTGPGRWNVHSPLPCGFKSRRHDISFMPPSSNRLGRQILNLGIRVRTPVGVPTIFRIVQPEMGWGRHRRVLGLASRHRNKNRE